MHSLRFPTASCDTRLTAPIPKPGSTQMRLGRLTGMVLVERFAVGKVAYSGGEGEIYEAADVMGLSEVVVKAALERTDADSRGSRAIRDRFRREIGITARLRHTNTVRHIASGTHDDVDFMVVERIDGQPLSSILGTVYALHHAKSILLQVCYALERVHELGHIHLDVKPQNLMITTINTIHGERPLVKLLDYGLAREVDGRLSDGIAGTPLYMSPEIIAYGDLDIQADIYAVGILMHALICGSEPFSHDHVQVVFDMHVNHPVPFMSQRRPDLRVHPDIEAIASKALNKNPRQRFTHIMEMAAAIAGASGWELLTQSGYRSGSAMNMLPIGLIPLQQPSEQLQTMQDEHGPYREDL